MTQAPARAPWRKADVPGCDDPAVPRATPAAVAGAVGTLRSLSCGRHIRTLSGPQELVDLLAWACADEYLKLTGAP